MDPSSEKSEHVHWQTSSQESREFAPKTPTVDEPYEDSVDFTAALLGKYEPALGSSPPATWHPRTTSRDILPKPTSTQPSKRVLSDFGGRFYRYSPGNLKGSVPANSGSPRKRLVLSQHNEQEEDQDQETLKDTLTDDLRPMDTPTDSRCSPNVQDQPKAKDESGVGDSPNTPPQVPQIDLSSSSSPEPQQHPDLELHWKRAAFIRLVVYQNNPDKSLWCRHEKGYCTVILAKSWSTTMVKQGDVLHIVASPQCDPPKYSPTIVVDNSLSVVVNPDVLVPTTTIAEAFSCDRQVLLRQRVRFPAADVSLPLVYGNIIHEAIQKCICEYDCTHKSLLEHFEFLLKNYLEELAILDKPVDEALQELQEKIPQIVNWSKKYMVPRPVHPVEVHRANSKNHTPRLAILGPKFTELEVWSPQWGIIGKLDCVVEATTSEGGKRLAGLEIKTGRSHTNSHRFQCALYNLLMFDRFGTQALPWTALYYSTFGDMCAIPIYQDEVRGLIQKRNSLVHYMNDPFSLAPPARSTDVCRFCFVKSACTKYAAAYQEHVEAGDMATQIQDETRGLTESHLEFIENWDTALTHEQLETTSRNKFIWLKSPQDRENLRQSIVGLKIKGLKAILSNGLGSRYLYELHRPADFPQNCPFEVNTPIYVSGFRTVLISTGYVQSKTKNTIHVVTNHKLSGEPGLSLTINSSKHFMSYSRGNLLRMFDNQKLTKLVVDKDPPQFEDESDFVCPDSFNPVQREAIKKAIGAKDYAIIRGMPGTGKTTTIVSLAQILVSRGKSVLLTGYTNSSVDNLVLKLLRKNVPVLRLGNTPASIHPQVLPVAACTQEPRSRAELDEIYMTPQIIATTSLSLSSWILEARHFDYCIVDEASQLTLPASLGALGYADKFILVGDDYQLNPIVKSEQAKKLGLQVSLFEYLAKAHPHAVVNLTMQYRMNSDIMRLSSELVYDGLLQCATPQVAQQKLQLRKLSPFHPCPPWLDVNRPVLFVNTDSVAAEEIQTTEGHYNPTEVRLVKEMIQGFVKHGLDANHIGVISEYKRQVQALQQAIAPIQPNLEVLTADRAQGRDKDCIIISLVRSNDEGKIGLLLKDWRRINVVFTRAKCKLVIIGSRKTLKSAAPLEKFLKVIESHNWMVDAQ